MVVVPLPPVLGENGGTLGQFVIDRCIGTTYRPEAGLVVGVSSSPVRWENTGSDDIGQGDIAVSPHFGQEKPHVGESLT